MKNKGLTLIEAIIAVFLITVGVVGFFSLFQKIINYNSIVSSRLTAAYLAQEGIELVRNIRDNYWIDNDAAKNWDTFYSDATSLASCNSDSGCQIDYQQDFFNACSAGGCDYLKIDSNGFYSYSGATQTLFKRKIRLTKDAEPVNVIVEVSWTEKGQNYQITVQENLYNWWND